MKRVSILGSTGSVGKATLDVVLARPDLFEIDTLTAHTNAALLASQAKESNAKLAVIGDETKYSELKECLSGTGIEAAAGRAAIIAAAGRDVDYAMAAIVGMAGLEPILAATKGAECVAIANKEPMVAAGDLVMNAAHRHGAILLPVDSEHNAVFQLMGVHKAHVRRIVLTASGGPFRKWSLEEMAKATPQQAVVHPNWQMGAKISVDSATMMNKALEVIEAHYLFGFPGSQIDVVVHPQSVMHAMVEFEDNSILAHMGAPDMRVPITHTLGWPNRIAGPAQRLDLAKLSTLDFEQVDHRRFPAINYAYDCLRNGASACIAMNAANEVAVAAFLAGNIGFCDIFEVTRRVVEGNSLPKVDNLESILALDKKMRISAQTCIVSIGNSTRHAPLREIL